MPRFLHTADWHLGRTFHGEPLLAAQAAAVDALVEAARSAAVDGVLVAGDLFDRALPPVDAVTLADEALRRLAEVAPVVVVPGNHDSGRRLAFGAGLLERSGLHLRTEVARCGAPVLLGATAVYALPYLEPDVVRGELGCERSHEAVLRAAMDAVRADLATRPAGTRSVVVAHAFVSGAQASGSERDLAVGGAQSAPASVFAGVDYVALGHLHGAQAVGTAGRYSGSPLAFSFGEAGHRKSAALVEVREGGHRAELVELPVPRPLAVLRGTLDTLLTDPALAVHEGAWVQATLTDPSRPVDAMERLRRRFPHAVVLELDPEGAVPVGEERFAARLRGLGDQALLELFVAEARGTAATPAERALLERALIAHRVAEEAA